jgi:hypothetical protein
MMPGGALQRFARRAEAAREKCDLCGEALRSQHRHLLESSTGQVTCACQACGLLFDRPAASRGKYRLIPDRHLILQDFALTDAEWESLHVPVGICFLMLRGGQPMAFYPSPMGATEAFVDSATWSSLAMRYPILTTIDADVEALLVNRARGARDHFIVPIDTCFSLVGLIRLRWRGLSGGSDAWTEIGRFFETLRARSRTHAMEVPQ